MCDRFLLLLAQNTKHYELLNYSEHGTTVDNVLYSCDFSEKMAPTPPSSIVAKVQSVISECPPSPALSCCGDPSEVLFPSAQLPLAWLLRRMRPRPPGDDGTPLGAALGLFHLLLKCRQAGGFAPGAPQQQPQWAETSSCLRLPQPDVLFLFQSDTKAGSRKRSRTEKPP